MSFYSGYKGIDIWLVPLPFYNNHGTDVVGYRVAELVGCSFRSIWKMTAVTLPLVFVFSLIYGEFIWSLAPIPVQVIPMLRKCGTSTLVTNYWYGLRLPGYSPFMDAIHGIHRRWCGCWIVGLHRTWGFWPPLLLLYGTVKGLGQTMPQFVVTRMAGALAGRFVMEKNSVYKCGDNTPWFFHGL